MKIKRLFIILFSIIFIVGLILFISCPYLFYTYGLNRINELPKPLNIKIDKSVRQKIWLDYQGEGSPKMVKVSPYDSMYSIICLNQASIVQDMKKCYNKYPGFRHAQIFAVYYLRESEKHSKQLLWEFSAFALSIWLTKNWSIDDILNGLYFYQENYYKKYH